MSFVYVALGGFFGAIFRFIFSEWNNSKFPIGTFAVNLVGSLLLGLLVASNVASPYYLLLGVGFLGAFTTFATLNKEILQMLFNGSKSTFIYLALTYAGGISLAFIGFWLGKILV